MKPWWKRKTFWTAVAAGVTGIFAALDIGEPMVQAIQAVLLGLIAIFLRESVENLKK